MVFSEMGHLDKRFGEVPFGWKGVFLISGVGMNDTAYFRGIPALYSPKHLL